MTKLRTRADGKRVMIQTIRTPTTRATKEEKKSSGVDNIHSQRKKSPVVE